MTNTRFRNVDQTDRELLANIWAAGGDHGVTTAEIVQHLGLSVNGKGGVGRTPARMIGSRLGAMRRFGFLERIDGEGVPIEGPTKVESQWRVTSVGQSIIKGRLTKGVETSLEKMDAGSHLMLMRELTRRAIVDGTPAESHAVRREYAHQMARRLTS